MKTSMTLCMIRCTTNGSPFTIQKPCKGYHLLSCYFPVHDDDASAQLQDESDHEYDTSSQVQGESKDMDHEDVQTSQESSSTQPPRGSSSSSSIQPP